jgi:cupin superfamily acireductone dioxygenase involved in methionine salvage
VLAYRVDELRQSGQSEANVERQLASFLQEHELTDEEIREKITLVSEFIARRETEVVEAAAREA